MVKDFANMNNDGLVTRALSRLEKEGVLIRLSQGLYLYPSRNKFGILRPSIEEIAYAVAEKEKACYFELGIFDEDININETEIFNLYRKNIRR